MTLNIQLKYPLAFSLLASITIPGFIFFRITDQYLPVYIGILVSHFIYTFLILIITKIKTSAITVDALLITGLISIVEIIISFLSIPVSYTFFLYDYLGFSALLPYVGSELSFAILVALCTLTGRLSLLLAVACLILSGLISSWNQHIEESLKKPQDNSLRIAIIQTVLPQRVTSYPGISDGLGYWKTRLIKALKEAQSENIDIALLPESTMPGFHPEKTPVIREILSAAQGYSLIGHRYVDISGGGTSSQVHFWDQNGTLEGIHEKKYPVPIAENQITPGQDAYFTYEGITIAPFICSETLNVYETRKRLTSADIGMVVTNEAEIKNTYLPELHLISDQIRAKESRTPIVRASNLRLSSYINATGEIELQSSDNSWQNLYITVSPRNNSFFSNTYLFQHVLIFVGTCCLLLRNKKFIRFSPSYTIYILLLFCIIRVQVTYGYEQHSSHYPDIAPKLYLNDLFPFRQLGVIDEYDMEQVKPYIHSTHIHIKDVPATRGIGVLNSIHGRIYILGRVENQYMTISNDGFLQVSQKKLEEVSISSVLWYAYEI